MKVHVGFAPVDHGVAEQGFDSSLVNAVNFGGKPIEPPPLDETGKPGGGTANRRVELWSNLKKALQGSFSLPAHAGYLAQQHGRECTGRLQPASGLSEPFSRLVKAYTLKHAGEEARVRSPANLRVRD